MDYWRILAIKIQQVTPAARKCAHSREKPDAANENDIHLKLKAGIMHAPMKNADWQGR